MGDVGTGAVAGEEDAVEVSVLGKPRLGAAASGGMGGDPLGGGPGVIIRGGERVLRGSAVLDGDGEDLGLGDEGVEVVVVGWGKGRLNDEAAAMEVDEDGELVFVGVGGEVETGGDTGGWVDGDVFGGDAGGGVDGGGDDVSAHDALDTAALVDANEGEEVALDFGVGIHRR